jgi:hypothetical protein
MVMVVEWEWVVWAEEWGSRSLDSKPEMKVKGADVYRLPFCIKIRAGGTPVRTDLEDILYLGSDPLSSPACPKHCRA